MAPRPRPDLSLGSGLARLIFADDLADELDFGAVDRFLVDVYQRYWTEREVERGR